jgi:tryptophanyl-tRNA synthetase
VDLHALTTLTDTSYLQDNIKEMALDWLAAGIDPERSIIFVQSHVPEVTELHLLLSMVTPLSWLLRVPTFKEKAKQQPDNINYGLVGYPVLMTADIILYKAEVVPVGEDQLPHLEIAREIVRRFNYLLGPT